MTKYNGDGDNDIINVVVRAAFFYIIECCALLCHAWCLAIVRNFMRAHSGDVKVTSEVDVGSTFTISLPYNQDKAGPGAGA